MTLDDFLNAARGRFDVDAPIYVRVHGEIREVTRAVLEIPVIGDGVSPMETTRRTVLELAAVSLLPFGQVDPIPALMQRMVDAVAPKKKPWEEDDDADSDSDFPSL